MTAIGEDVSTILDINYDEDVPCEGYRATCPNTANWRLVVECCKRGGNACNACKQAQDEYIELFEYHCAACGADNPNCTWRPI